ncbi:hypothetical protein EYF80_008179 [Liparis tanakae]|uniref:Uncharacterized protein n=1 Tax=Liparis tanakae TaxID=230148 RepID=A0A4Z2IWU3_9TELE|nr:hypothetical protein EYF80_008179 [Liparis tanakae]
MASWRSRRGELARELIQQPMYRSSPSGTEADGADCLVNVTEEEKKKKKRPKKEGGIRFFGELFAFEGVSHVTLGADVQSPIHLYTIEPYPHQMYPPHREPSQLRHCPDVPRWLIGKTSSSSRPANSTPNGIKETTGRSARRAAATPAPQKLSNLLDTSPG